MKLKLVEDMKEHVRELKEIKKGRKETYTCPLILSPFTHWIFPWDKMRGLQKIDSTTCQDIDMSLFQNNLL